MFFLNLKRGCKFLLLLLVIPFSASVMAEGELYEELIVHTEQVFPPYTTVDKNGEVTGFSVELLKAIAHEEKLNIRWEIKPWSETIKALEVGAVDVAPMVLITDERRGKFLFSNSYIRSFDATFIRRGDEKISNLSDLLENEIIVIRDYATHEYMANDLGHQHLILVEDAKEGMTRLAKGEGDAMMMFRLPGLAMVRELALDNVETIDVHTGGYADSAIAISKLRVDLVPIINRGLAKVKANGIYDRLFNKWIKSADQTAISHAETQRSLNFTITAFVFIVALMAIFILVLRSIIVFKTAQLSQELEERRHLEKIADQNEGLFRGAFESSMQGSALLETDGSWVRVNQALCDLLGCSREALISTNIKDFLIPDDYKTYLESVQALVIGNQESCALEFQCLCFGREWKWVRVFLYRIQRESQEHCIYAQIQDISAKKGDEERLNNMLYDLEFMRSSLNRHAIISRTDTNGIITYVNDKFCSVSQFSSEELVGCDHGIINSGFHNIAFFKDLWRTISSGQVWQGDVCNRRKDGSPYWVSTTIVPHIGANNKPDFYLSIRTEITEIKEAEDNLKSKREFLNTILENIKDGIVVLNEQGEVALANPAAINYLGDIGLSDDGKLSDNDMRMPPELKTAINKAMVGKASIGVPMVLSSLKQGALHDLLMSCYPLTSSSGTQSGLLVSMHDVTDQLNAEKELSHSNLRFDAFFENAATAIDIFDAEGNILKVNKAFEEMFGYSEGEVKKLGFIHITHPEDVAITDAKFQDFINGVIDSYQIEKRYIHKNGSTVWGRLTTFSVGSQEEGSYMVGMIADVTHEKNMAGEQARLQRRLQQVEKMEAIGALTGGIAHDFNNILASIMGYTDLAMMKFCHDREGKLNQYLTEVYKAGERARDLVGQMMDFSRAGGGSRSNLSMSPIVKETLKMVAPTLPSSIEVNYECDEESVPFISIDPVRLNQVVMNLVINARDALDGKGEISVSVKTYTGGKTECLACHKVIQKDYVELIVADSGVGISKNELQRIFDPFYTTKDVGKGTGMGLSVVHGIVHEYDGHILVDSEKGKGSTFRILFEALSSLKDENSGSDIVLDEVAPLRKRIMIIDDESMITDYLKELLVSEGHQVSVYNCSKSALADFQNSSEHFDLVITDQTMPGILGVELAAEMKKITPDLPVILCTGYSELNIEALTRDFDDIRVMKKPIDRQALISLINFSDNGN